MIIPFARRRLPAALALAAAIGGTAVALHYHRLGLTLSHYDARGHLVVARRIIDSITPGWQQVGAVWLPLPHLLNAIPIQLDTFYRSGASAVAISIASFAVAVGAIGWIVLSITESVSAAAAAAAVFAFNPNVLYLQSTPMTEPLLLALTTLAVAMLMAWCEADHDGARGFRAREEIVPYVVSGFSRTRHGPPKGGHHVRFLDRLVRRASVVGSTFALACLTRYEAWPVTACALAAAVWVRWRHGDVLKNACRAVGRIALYPAIAIVAFAIFSRVVIGAWLFGGGFFVPENKAIGDPMLAAAEVAWGVRTLSGRLLVAVAMAGFIIAFAIGLASKRRTSALLVLSLLAMAAIPWTAFVDGHPFRIRYMVPLIAMEAIGAGIAAGVVRRAGVVCAVALIAIVAYELRPLDRSAPMVMEAQWDRPNTPVRERVTACLGAPGSGQKIMASMGSLGHYMQEAARAGFSIRDFLHEGNGDIWLAALGTPRPFADWVLIEEKAEGGDMLARIARERPSFLNGYTRACEGAGLALYRRRH